jgi:ABC-2 type transport system ATP-binding protein
MKEVFAGSAVLEVACPRYLDALSHLEDLDFVLEASLFGTRLHLIVDDVEGARRRVSETLEAAGIPVESIDRVVPSLEDVFIHYIEKEEAARTAAGAS